jgi:hypothetical protein
LDKYEAYVKKAQENNNSRQQIYTQIDAAMTEFSKEKQEERTNAAARVDVTLSLHLSS